MIDLVYVLGSTETRRVKIGHSTDVPKRAADIQRMSPVPLAILDQFEGGLELEGALHKRFRPFRTHGEWFDFGDLDPLVEIAAGVEAHRAAKLLAPEVRRNPAGKIHAVTATFPRRMHPQARAIAEAIAAIDLIADPIDRACDASSALRIIQNGNATLAALRRSAVEELHGTQGWSYRRIGESIGVNHARVGQILSGEPTGVGVPGRKPKKSTSSDTEV